MMKRGVFKRGMGTGFGSMLGYSSPEAGFEKQFAKNVWQWAAFFMTIIEHRHNSVIIHIKSDKAAEKTTLLLKKV